jgi:hypothetical protein
MKAIPALVGEIFIEEERTISAVYEGILRAIANGKVVSTEISSTLFSRKLIKKDDPSIIQQYLCNSVKFGIIKRVKVYGKNKFVYKHTSPLVRLFYYADEKYNLSERIPTEAETEQIINKFIPLVVEDCMREFFADWFGLTETIIEAKDYDIDCCLLKFKRPAFAIEIKWKKKISQEDISKAEQNLSKIDAKRKLFFVPDKSGLSSKHIDIVDISDFMD